jgi:cysteine-rich repeat protein
VIRFERLLARALAVAAFCALTACTPPSTEEECASGQGDCSGVCRDLRSDKQNCGACGNTCAAGFTCEAGSCKAPVVTCGPEQTNCSGACRLLQSDTQNCGACGNVCPTGNTCTGGRCVAPIVIVCGDGRIQGSEACDDGNAVSTDGCSASCQVEPRFTCSGEPSKCIYTEVEPNDAVGTANPTGRARWMRGSLGTGADVDVFRITVPAEADLRLDTFDGSGAETCVDIDTMVELLAEDGTVLAADDDSGPGYCSTIDPTQEPGASRLPAGTYHVRVTSYDSAIPAYVLRVRYDALCGNGQREGAELCDDGNTAEGDACNAFCRPSPVPETESNDSAASANGPFTLPMTVKGAINPVAERDMYRFTVPATADVRFELFDASGRASCQGIDTELSLYASDGVTPLAYDDDSGLDSCSAIDPSSESGARRMAPGTYYVRVNSYSGTIPGYTLMGWYDALCGDGRKSGHEECDGTTGCSATCERTPSCGDGFVDHPEFCDDGNTVNGDSCDNTCSAAGLQSEVEPNDTRTAADARATAATPVLINGTKRLAAAFGSETDVDFFRMQLAAPSLVRLETFHGGLNRCASGLSAQLQVLDSTGMTLEYDATSGMDGCSALATYLQAGTYYVQVDNTDYLEPVTYALEAVFQSGGGSEAEPNETRSAATALTGVDSFVNGRISTVTDVDYYRITVPAGASVRAEILGGGTVRCDDMTMDSQLTLLDASGSTLADDDDGASGYCSRLDGTGSSPDDSGASGLSAGTYYLRVKASSLASSSDALFDYRLSVTIR